MKASQNIGIVNALIRITVGLTILTFSTAKLVKKPWRDSYLVLAVIGAMKVGEGILRYCPITALFENKEGSSSSSENSMSSNRKSTKDIFDVKNFDLTSFLSKSESNQTSNTNSQTETNKFENGQTQDAKKDLGQGEANTAKVVQEAITAFNSKNDNDKDNDSTEDTKK